MNRLSGWEPKRAGVFGHERRLLARGGARTVQRGALVIALSMAAMVNPDLTATARAAGVSTGMTAAPGDSGSKVPDASAPVAEPPVGADGGSGMGIAAAPSPEMSDAEEIAMINEWRLRYGRIYRAEKIFRVVSFLGLGTTGLGIAGLVFAGSACDEDEDPCTIRQASWGITGAGIGLSVGGLGGWLAYRIIRQRHVDAVLQDSVVRLEPSPTGLMLRF